MNETAYKRIDPEHNTWMCGSCGHIESFEADGPYENGWNVCPHCGKNIARKADATNE